MCFGCSKEPSHQDGSLEYPQHMFWMRNKEYSFPKHTLMWRPVCVCIYNMSSDGSDETAHACNMYQILIDWLMVKSILPMPLEQLSNTNSSASLGGFSTRSSSLNKNKIYLSQASFLRVIDKQRHHRIWPLIGVSTVVLHNILLSP